MDVPNSPTMQALLDFDMIGVFEVIFIDGETRTLDIRKVIHSSAGEPIYLQVEDGTVYMWSRMIAVKLKED